MVIIVTGKIGSGKSTACRKFVKLAQELGYACDGVLTFKTERGDIVIEDIRTGEKKHLASTKNIYQGPRTGSYFFSPEGIDFGVRVLNRHSSGSILVIDEIGYLELRGEGFAQPLELVKAGKVRDCILVIRSELLSSFMPQLPGKPVVFSLTGDNRDKLPQEITRLFLAAEKSG